MSNEYDTVRRIFACARRIELVAMLRLMSGYDHSSSEHATAKDEENTHSVIVNFHRSPSRTGESPPPNGLPPKR